MNSTDVKAKSSKKQATAEEICSVRVGPMLYGMPIRHILEIIGSARPQPVPLAPAFVGGLMHYRGDVLTTVSLRRLLGLSPNDGAQDILVIDHAEGCFGLLVDSVGEVLTVSSDDFEATPATVIDQRKALLAGAYKLKDQLLIMLDADRLDPMRLSGFQAA